MLRQFFSTIPNVTKNLLILNVIVFIYIITGDHIGAMYERNFQLGLFYFGSPYFKPYQIVSHMFAHGNVPHLIFNMFALAMFGAVLERVWGAKRFLIFYLVTGLGAMLLHESANAIRVYQLAGELFPISVPIEYFDSLQTIYTTPAVGASGAIYGLLIAFAMLFPNTEMLFLFIPVPIKAKYLVPILVGAEFIFGIGNFSFDNVAHFAHLGGALFGFILVKLWNKNRNQFY